MALRFLRSLLWSQRGLAIWLIVVVAIVAAWFLLNRNAILNYLTQFRQRNELRDHVAQQESETRELERQRDVLSNDGFESEKAARQRFHLSKPGEKVLYLEPPPGRDTPTTPSQESESRSNGRD